MKGSASSKWIEKVTEVGCLLGLVVLLSGCSPSQHRSEAIHWKTYHNERYGFEFPYPSNWIVGPIPSNGDGQVFFDPKNPTVEIRGWGGYNIQGLNATQDHPAPLKPENFTTAQGLHGALAVELGTRESSMTLTIVRDDIRYQWRGRSPSEVFDDYYRFFYYVATQYRIDLLPKEN
jgi:hypothetical protein